MKKLLLVLTIFAATGCKKQCDTYSVLDGNDCIAYAERLDGHWQSTGNGSCTSGDPFGMDIDLVAVADNIIRFDSNVQLVFSSSTQASGGPWTFSDGSQTWTVRIQANYTPASGNQYNQAGQVIPNSASPENLVWKVWKNENTGSASVCTVTLIR